MININTTLLIQLANFLLLMFLLNRLLFKPVVRLLDERAARTEGRVAEAEQAAAEADATLADYEAKIRAARADADLARGEVLREAEAQRQSLLEKAAAEAEKTVAEIRSRVSGEVEQARKVLQGESERLAADAAQRIFGEEYLMSRYLSRTASAVAVALLIAMPTLVWAAGGGSGRDPWTDLGLKFVNFAILVGMLFYFLRKPIKQALADRREDIRKALDDARQAKDAAEAKCSEYQQRVANLEQEVAEIRDAVRAEAERQKEHILVEAQRAAESVRTQAQAAGENEVKRAQDQLRQEAVQLSVQLAEQLLTKNYSAEDQKKALAQTIQNVEGIH